MICPWCHSCTAEHPCHVRYRTQRPDYRRRGLLDLDLAKLLPPSARYALLGAAALASATTWLDRRIAHAVEPVAAQVSALDRDVRATDAALAAANDRQDSQIAALQSQVSDVRHAIDLDESKPSYAGPKEDSHVRSHAR